MMRALAVITLLCAAACAPKNVPIQEEPDWRTDAGQERVRMQLIASLIDRGNAREALMLIKTSRERGDTDPDLDLHQASALTMIGLHEDAERLLLAYLGRRGRDVRAWRRLGILQADSERLDEAAVSLQRAIDLDDSHADTWNNLGFVYMTLQRHDEAIEALRRSIALDGTNTRFRNNLGFALAGAGQAGDALQLFKSTSPPADAHANMGLALERYGDPVSATQQYAIALEYDPNHAASRQALDRLTAELETLP